MYILTGTHSVGKSTLLNEIRKQTDFYTTDGFSRPVKSVKKRLGFDNTVEQELINELTMWAFENYLGHKKVITARSPIDLFIYSSVLTPEINTSLILNNFLNLKNQIDKVFYIPIEFDLVDDGTRFNDIFFQKEIDKQLISFLETYNIPYVTITGTVNERVQQVLSHLK